MGLLRSKEVRAMDPETRAKKLVELREGLMHERGVAAMGGAPPSPRKNRGPRGARGGARGRGGRGQEGRRAPEPREDPSPAGEHRAHPDDHTGRGTAGN